MKKIIYLYKSGELVRKDYSLAFLTKSNNTYYIPVEQVDTIMCFGEITLNKRVFGLLNVYHISIMFFNYYGHYIGRFVPKKYADGKIIVHQVHMYENNEQRLLLAKSLTYGELKNCLSLLKYYNKKGFILSNIVENLKISIKNIEKIQSIEELLLLEAKAKKLYYSSFDIILNKNQYHFHVRSKNPPKNEINTLLSYGYALLYGTILSDIDKSSLISQISFIHSLSKENDSLQFDIADVLKPVYIDRLIIRIVRKNQLKKDYFTYDDETCRLNKDGIKFFVSQYENLLEKSIYIHNRYYSYRNIITREVYQLADYIEGKNNRYKPYVMEW